MLLRHAEPGQVWDTRHSITQRPRPEEKREVPGIIFRRLARAGWRDALEDRDVRAEASPDDPTIAQLAQNASVVVLECVLWSPRA